MTIFKKELRSGAVSFLAWSAVIGGLMAVCVGMYPSMAGSMGDVSDLFAGMGNFSAAFGLDKLQFGTISTSMPSRFPIIWGNCYLS